MAGEGLEASKRASRPPEQKVLEGTCWHEIGGPATASRPDKIRKQFQAPAQPPASPVEARYLLFCISKVGFDIMRAIMHFDTWIRD
jgi:hypothetical protein